MEERQAIARLKRGDFSGLEMLVNKYQVQAVQTSCLIVQDKALAEDIVQNAFITVAEKIHQFDSHKPFAPWFFRSVVNASIKAMKNGRRSVSIDEMQEQDNSRLQELLTDTQPGPEEWYEQEEHNKQIWQLLDRLPPDQKAAIVMRHFLDMSETEMVDQLQRPRSTIKYWLRVAREQLRRFLYPFSAIQKPADEEFQSNENRNG